MNTIYGGVSGIQCPEIDWKDMEEYQKKCDAYVKQLQTYAKQVGKQSYSGKVVRFQVADGYAEYVIIKLLKKGCELIHINTMDGYQDPNVEYISKEGFINKLKQQEAMEKLFNRV